MNRIVSLLLICLVSWGSQAASYFVDFSAGSDVNNGTSTATPWKHCPDDPNATGTAGATVLAAGDTVFFKGGVSYNGTIASSRNGTALAPITFQGYSSWGTTVTTNTGHMIVNYGAVMEGTVGGVTNQWAFSPQGNYQTITGFEIRDYTNGILAQGNFNVISNNSIHHLGTYPYDTSMGSSQGGQAINFPASSQAGQTVGTSGGIVVSNLVFDCNYNGITDNTHTNLIIWGNELAGIQSHGMQPSFYGNYGVLAYNFIHDETNQVNHSDAIQVLGVGPGCTNIIVGNVFSNNIDCLNLQPFFTPIGPTNISGTFFVFNNISMNGQPGTGGEAGNVNGNEFDTYGNVTALYAFNNTFVDHNGGWGGFRVPTYRATNLTITNVFQANNLYYNSLGGWNDGYTNGTINTIFTGYNLFTNTWRSGVTLANDTNAGNNLVILATYQSDMAAQHLEANSVYSPVTFANYSTPGGVQSGADFHLSSGGAIGNGTNLTAQWGPNTFAYLPATFAIDPTKDIAGTQRSASAQWDIGAYAVVSDPAITVQPSNQTVALGQTATFSVTATGTAPISYFWYKQGGLIQAGSSSSYTTSPTTCAYNGNTVFVTVSNSVGQVTSTTATLTVTGCQGTSTNYASQIGTANIGAARF